MLFVRMMPLSRKSLLPDLNSTVSTPALMLCTHFSFLAARTSAGVMAPM